MEYEAVIGLEVHAELSTRTKIYCTCKNAFGGEVNTQCCPVCTGMPGTLPTLNEKVVEYAAKMGLATHCSINRVCKQDRKNYFYPDLPKAYQISQFDVPLCEHGYIDFWFDGKENRVGLTRIHIEEDAGKLLHGDSFSGSLVDFNRCGVPLIEIVSEPDLRSAPQANAYLDAVRSILAALDISDCKMQEGSIRCDVNVSIRPRGSEPFGTRCEMKNVNSFSGAQRAIEYEITRQTALVEAGGTVEQETRRWDDDKGMSFTMRSKEDAQDYRYFPEPDLRTIAVGEAQLEAIRASIPELPPQRFLRMMKQYQLSEFDAGLLAEDTARAAFFEACAALNTAPPKTVANWLDGDVARILNDRGLTLAQTPLTPEKLARLLKLVESGEISGTAGKTVLDGMFEGGDPDAIVRERGLSQVSDRGALVEIVKAVLAENEKSVADYKKGKTNAAGFLVGQCMRRSQGRANPQVVKDILLEEIEKL